MRYKHTLNILVVIIFSINSLGQSIDLSGEWDFSYDSLKWENTIKLPGSMLENHLGKQVTTDTKWTASIYDSSYFYNPNWAKYREPGNIKLPFFLTPERHYIGKAWYKKNIHIKSVNSQSIITLERVHIQSTLYINGEYVNTEYSLSTPHRYDVSSYLKQGVNEIMICVNNDPDICGVGKDSHSITDQTQGNWNGIVGKMLIEFAPQLPPYKTDSTFRKFEIIGKSFYLDGNKIFLRGTVDNCNFPLTGYPPMDEESWEKVFKQCSRMGLNHVRFHSYCPPEAAFAVADRYGIILQIEGPSWPNHGVKLGVGEKVDTYLWEEVEKIVNEYGHHASFCMLSAGNEPRGQWVPWVSKFTNYWSKMDNRRVYTGASVGGRWAWQPESQYHVKAGLRGLDSWKEKMPQTMDDFSEIIDTISQPFIGHEIGQWCAFPNLGDTVKYTGVYKAENLRIFRDELEKNGMLDMAEKFHYASGKLQLLCYKYEIEKILRTKDYAGFQMLGLNDYTGQGTAIVGLKDVFYDDKIYCRGGEWRDFTSFCWNCVPLIRMPKFVYSEKDIIEFEVELYQYIKDDSKFKIECWIKEDEMVNGGKMEKILDKSIKMDMGTNKIGKVCCKLPKTGMPQKMNIMLFAYYEDDEYAIGNNSWDIWVYPEKVDFKYDKVLVTDTLNIEAKEMLRSGGKVLLLANKKLKYGLGIKQSFLPIFWNTSWFKMRPPHTTGLYIEKDHPVFGDFVTEEHSELQWWELVNNAPMMLMSDFPKGMMPIVQPIDTWFCCRKLGMLFEAEVLGGKLMVTTMDLETDMEARIVARQMKASILNYMNSKEFVPKNKVELEVIENLFIKDTPHVGYFSKEMPDEISADKL